MDWKKITSLSQLNKPRHKKKIGKSQVRNYKNKMVEMKFSSHQKKYKSDIFSCNNYKTRFKKSNFVRYIGDSAKTKG